MANSRKGVYLLPAGQAKARLMSPSAGGESALTYDLQETDRGWVVTGPDLGPEADGH